jgi:hypothetical protein
MTEDQIKHMVNRFLGWRLPENFSPDDGISFNPIAGEHGPHPFRRTPSGTNLFDATQADAMVRYMVEGLPDPASGNAPEPFAWLVLSEETGNTRLWSRNGDIAKTFAGKHGLECIALYRADPVSGNAQEAVTSTNRAERCPTCNMTDVGYSVYVEGWCRDPWHGDDHLRQPLSLNIENKGDGG